MTIEADTSSNHSLDKLSVQFHHRVCFHFESPKSLQDIHDEYAGVFLRFLSLVTGTRIFIDEFRVFEADPSGPNRLFGAELLQDCSGVSRANRTKHAHSMTAAYAEIADQFGKIVERWFECQKRMSPVLDLYLNVKAFSLTAHHRFLLLAQALEVYHARSQKFTSAELSKEEHAKRVDAALRNAPIEIQQWLKERLTFSNQKTLAQRIDEVLRANENEITKLTTEINDFPQKVRWTRNYYTHYSADSEAKAAKGEELTRLGFALEALLEICLLKDLGIEGKPIQRILGRLSRMKFVHLNP